jgi:hypothetical protein
MPIRENTIRQCEAGESCLIADVARREYAVRALVSLSGLWLSSLDELEGIRRNESEKKSEAGR